MIFPDGRTKWGNGNPVNEDFEAVVHQLLEEGINGAKVLDVGSGRYKVHDICVGVDAYTENDGVNVKAYMWDMPFYDDSIDTIFCFHALEHISKYQVLPTLDEFHRVLKPGGKILLLVPNLEWVLIEFLKNPNPQWEMDMIYGVQSHDQKTINEGEFHRTGFTPTILRTYLELIPFNVLEWFNVHAYNQQNIGVLAEKER
jgi:predicted SAM-dependent methyltransferase